MAKLSWGLSPEIIRTIYVAVIEPIILYGASVWAPAAKKIYVKNQLNSVQRSFALKICKAYRTVSLTAALLLANLIPLDLRVEEMATLYEAKRGKPQVTIDDRTVERRISYLSAPHPAHEIIHDFKKLEDLSDETIRKNDLTGLMIFTDGSKIDGKVGAAFSCWKDGDEIMMKKFCLESYCSVFQAEIYALCHATEVVLTSTENTVNILSDSRSALELIRNPTNHPLAFMVREKLREAKDQLKVVRLFWIRAHNGVTGNERADHLAKEAAQNNTIVDYDECPLSYIKKTIRRTSIKLWDQRYSESKNAALTKVFFPDVISAYKILNKIKLTPILVQTLTGHGGFSQYLYRFKCKDSPTCDCDNEAEESVLHVLTECPKFGKKRMELEQLIEIKINKNTLHVIIANKKISNLFIEFCDVITRKVKLRNNTTIR